jgi:hypothetical protein
MGLLEIDALAASLMIRDINSGVEGLPILHWVTHHDLVTYLHDTNSIAEVPEHQEEFSSHGIWLLENDWLIDQTRKTFRWVDPADQTRRVNLRSALLIQMCRERDYVSDTEEEEVVVVDPDIIDAEYTILLADAPPRENVLVIVTISPGG